ncbi:hypothetical protein GQ600_9644 [Phytophthora cactorum]|nr:hypothetical protein GQ600_9644 [Phytophthora cactorum]
MRSTNLSSGGAIYRQLGRGDQLLSYLRSYRGSTIAPVATSQPSHMVHLEQNMMATDVVYNAEQGSKAILSSWSILQWFDEVDVELEDLQRSDIPEARAFVCRLARAVTTRRIRPRLECNIKHT